MTVDLVTETATEWLKGGWRIQGPAEVMPPSEVSRVRECLARAIWTHHLSCHMVWLSVILLCYGIACLWFCNRRFLCNKTGVLFVGDPVQHRYAGVIHIWARMQQDSVWFQHNTQTGTQFKTHELFVSGIFHLMFSVRSGLWVTETAQSKTVGREGRVL